MQGSPVAPASPVERLLERLKPQRARRLSRGEIRMELVSGAALALAVGVLALAFESDRHAGLGTVAGLVALCAVLAHIRLYVGGGYGMPTQLALVPMLFLLPPALVPVAMAAGLALAVLADVLRREAHPDRLLVAIGDSWHAVGPALVFAVAGSPAAEAASWAVLIPAFAAQALTDCVTGSLREFVGRGIPPELQLRVMAWVYGVDALLTPVGFLAVVAPVAGGQGHLLLAPLAVLLAGLVTDRRRRIDEEAARADELRRERARLQAVLRRVGQVLAANLDPAAMLAAIRETAQEALDAPSAFAGPAAGARDDALLHPVVTLAAENAGTAAVDAGGWHALACRLGRCPTSEVLAVARRDRPFDAGDMELLHHLAAHAAVSLENARLHARVHQQASTDELTGLANHRTLWRVLEEHLSRGERFAPRLSLVLLDIDDFKAVNDTWGHLQGDRVLRAVADAIRARCRAIDRPARYGGEELAVALPRTDAAGALQIAEDLRRAVEAVVVEQPDGPPLRVTVSVGVATAPADGATPSALVDAADRALYEAKRSGKNRVAGAGTAVVA